MILTTWPLSIIIYKVEIYDENHLTTICTHFFLTLKRARAFVGRNRKVIEETDSKYLIGGVQLWLW